MGGVGTQLGDNHNMGKIIGTRVTNDAICFANVAWCAERVGTESVGDPGFFLLLKCSTSRASQI